MQLTIGGEILDLPEDFKISFKVSNPFLGEIGNFSYPCTIPATGKNKALTNFPENLERSKKFKLNSIIQLRNQVREITGNFVLEYADSEEISFNIDSNEGAVYAAMKEKKLEELDWGGERTKEIYKGQTRYPHGWITYLKNLIDNNFSYKNADFAIFPVFIKQDQNKIHLLNKLKFGRTKEHYYGLNFWADGEDDFDPISDKRSFKSITPFLYLHYVIDNVLKSINLEIIENDLKQRSDLDYCVVLNNSTDAFALPDWTLNYNRLLPDCTVFEFIKEIEKTFACTFYFDMQNATCRILSNSQIIAAQPTKDLTQYLIDNLQFKHEPFQELILSGQRNCKNAAVLYDNFEEVSNKFLGIRYVDDIAQIPTQRNLYTNHVYYVKNDYSYYRQQESIVDGKYTYVADRISSPLFNLPYNAAIKNEYSIESNVELLSNLSFEVVYPDYGRSSLVKYKCSAFIDGIRSKVKNSSEFEGKDTPCPIAFSIYRGTFDQTLRIEAETVDKTYKTPYGTAIEHGAFSLSFIDIPHGGYSLQGFWEATANLLRHSFIPVSAKMNIPATVLQQIKLDEKIIIGNQEFLIESWTEEHSSAGITLTEFNLRTVKKYDD